MKKLIIGLMAVGLVGMMVLPAMAATTDSANVNLYVTPVVVVDLNVSPTYYDFGFVDVETSTASVTALTLTNDGDVGINIDKTVWDDGAWYINLSTTTQDGFDLWALTNATQLGHDSYIGGHAFSETKQDGGFTRLTNLGGTDEDLDPEETANLWFRLDMPRYVTTINQQTIHIRLRAMNKE